VWRIIIHGGSLTTILSSQKVPCDDSNSETPFDPPTGQPLVSLIYAVLRLRLVALYRHRLHPSTPKPSILAPLINLVVYRNHTQHLHSVLKSAKRHLGSTGLHISLAFKPIVTSADELVKKLQAGGLATLRIGEERAVHLSFSSPAHIYLHLPHISLTVMTMSQLRSLLEDEIRAALVSAITDQSQKT
jgi:hypothetical protein